MQELVQRTWSERSRLHIGDLAWERTSMLGRQDTWRTALWEDDGQVVAWGWIELSEHLSLVVDPARPELVAEVLAWRRGLAQAVNLAALHAVRDAGAVEALVCPRGDDGYPMARKLYQSIGFRPGARSVTYVV